MLGVDSDRMLTVWQVCSILNKKKTGIALKANTASQMKAKMYVTMMNCCSKKVQHTRSQNRNTDANRYFPRDKCGVIKSVMNHNSCGNCRNKEHIY